MDEKRFSYEGPTELLPTVVQALEKVVDPEVALNIVDVGLVYGVKVADGRMDVDITMTSAACPVTDIIVDDVENALDDAMPPELKIHVELVWEPPWTPQRMSPRARAFMGW
ncbi:metal-sulfur cluster assembly factor [Ramlibacter sp. USB13]|uniref:Metal-sulfur cluster assembly factor n=1 Tax=Ramlibacter cellulosilyticus TaxID=2764187 RepID=A0A923SEN0_9BURK|nr:metal-sulfur cluster assembly factor [Ramlibacter cellulosilyticus]MBC5783102.1 metal-sulfur cluster assembly factor [Ramlibacter cellulosilyticus]